MSDVLNFGKMPLTELGRAMLELDRLDALRLQQEAEIATLNAIIAGCPRCSARASLRAEDL